MNNDKKISLTILLISSFMIIIWVISIYNNLENSFGIFSLNIESLLSWAKSNTDIVFIIYIFFCLQFAGISEFKQKQDYLVVSLISIIFTPIGLLFIKNDSDND